MKAIEGTDIALQGVGVAMTIVNVVLLGTVILAPLVLPLQATALGMAALGVGGKFVNKRLMIKMKKHDQIDAN